jgi:hypothetical protein
MSIKIVVSDTVGIKVKGTINDAAGKPQPFDFSLTCVRLDQDQIKDKVSSETDAPLVDFLVDVVEDWTGVRDEEDKPLPYSQQSLRRLLKIPGLAGMAFKTYLLEAGSKEKN